MPVDYTADLVLLTPIDLSTLGVLLVRRRDDSDAFPGALALPGGFVEDGETSWRAAIRETLEETGVAVPEQLVQAFRVYDEPGRDPRGRVVSSVHMAHWDPFKHGPVPSPKASSDAKEALILPVTDVLRVDADPLAFDHRTIVRDVVIARGFRHVAERADYA